MPPLLKREGVWGREVPPLLKREGGGVTSCLHFKGPHVLELRLLRRHASEDSVRLWSNPSNRGACRARGTGPCHHDGACFSCSCVVLLIDRTGHGCPRRRGLVQRGERRRGAQRGERHPSKRVRRLGERHHRVGRRDSLGSQPPGPESILKTIRCPNVRQEPYRRDGDCSDGDCVSCDSCAYGCDGDSCDSCDSLAF